VASENRVDGSQRQKQIPRFARNDSFGLGGESGCNGAYGGVERCGSAGTGAGDVGAIAQCVEGAAKLADVSGNYAGHRFSALDQINTSNAASLVPKWAYQTMAGGKFETTPLVVDGVLYGTGQDDRMFALDASPGGPFGNTSARCRSTSNLAADA